ncbi:MAG: class I SAM-dependent DNA methyltransferase [Cyclobacteriaceae bacterium]
MTNEQIKELEKELWDAADQLRANSKLTAAEYKDPVLGLILLRFAQNRYEEAKVQVEASIPDGPRGKRAATKEDFTAAGAIMLPEVSKYDYLADLPESKDIAEAINEAMRQIEVEYPDLAGILPKNYQDFETDLLRELIRVFNKDAVKKATGDIFGRIYEYFLMKFSMQGAGAQEGGEFFTPPSLVQLIVNFIEPDHGIIHDPACGSGGMFVQTGHFVQTHSNRSVNEAIKCYGTELKTNNTKLAKMNLAIHGIEGKIIEANSFYSDPHNLVGKCDFVMANPPFNVNKIDREKEFVKTDQRLFEGVGVPKTDNGNYMWMQYFYHYLNPSGRAGFVMSSSATDAGHSEKLIRQKLIETGHVDCIVAVSNNFFYTRSLPCHLWFFDKGKLKENQDKILMIDARNVFRKVTTTINDFSPEQMEGLTAIMKMYRGEEVNLNENEWTKKLFPDGHYQDVEGLCKIVDIEEVKEQDYSLTPGRYVGVTIFVDNDFDYKSRLNEITSELNELHHASMEMVAAIKSNSHDIL